MPDIDYAALAKQAGAISSQPAGGGVDYAAIAKQFGAVESKPAAGGFLHNAGQFIKGAWETVPSVYDAAVKPVVDLARSIHGGNGSGAIAAAQRVINPAGSMAADTMEAQLQQGRKAVQAAGQGRMSEAVGHSIAAVTPVVGPAAADAGEMIGDGETARGLGRGAGLIAGAFLPHAMAPAAELAGKLATRTGSAVGGAVGNMVGRVVDTTPRPLSPGASALADHLGVPLTKGMQGGSKTVQAVEKMLGHSVAPDLYEPLIEKARQGVTEGAKQAAGGFAVDKFTAGDNMVRSMLDAAKEHETTASREYEALRQHEANPDNTRSVQVGMKENPSTEPGAPAMIPDMKALPLPTDYRGAKAAVAPELAEIHRAMTPAERNMDPGLHVLENVMTRPDHVAASTAERDLGYMKDVQRSDATAQAKRLVGIVIDALQPAIDRAVSAAGPEALDSLQTARGSWAARSSILDQVKALSNDTTGRSGQVMAVNKLLQPSDASYPALEQVLNVAPGAAQELGKAYLTDRVFAKAANGEDFTNPQQAQNILNHLGPRTRAALFTPEQWDGLQHTFELAKRVAENPNPSGTGIVNTLLKMGVMVTHPGTGLAGFAMGRRLANLLYYPNGLKLVESAIAEPSSPTGLKAAAAVKSIMSGTNPPDTPPAAAAAPAGPPPVPPPPVPPAAAAAPGEPPPLPAATIPTNGTQTEQPAGGNVGTMDAGTAQPRATLPEPASAGNPEAARRTVVAVPGEARRYAGEYQLKELSEVQPSHNAFNFQPNPKYGLMNDRNYDNPVNQGKIVNWSVQGPAGFDPAELVNDIGNSSSGPPVLDSAGNILGGNGRGMILKRIYKSNPAGAQAYREMIAKKAQQFGLDPAAVAGMKEPVLVRVLDDAEFSHPAQKQAAITDFNKVGTAALTHNERAISDSRRVSTSTLDDISRRMDDIGAESTLAQTLEGKSGVEVLNNLIADGVISPHDRADLATQHELSKAGKARIEALMTGRYFGTAAQMDATPKSVMNKVQRMAAPLAHVEGLKDYNLSPWLQEAMGILEDARGHGLANVDDYLHQQGMFAEQNFSRGAVSLAKQLLERDPTKLQAAARGYAEDAKYANEYQGPGFFQEFPDPLTPAENFEKHFGTKALEREAEAKSAAAASRKARTDQPKQ